MDALNTATMLFLQHGKAVIPLEEVCESYFGMDKRTAYAKAYRGELPVPAFRATDSRKAPWLVSVLDLAKLLEERRAEEARQHAALT